MKVRALAHVIGLRPGEEAEVDPAEPAVRAALAAGMLEDLSPIPVWPIRRDTAVRG